jgi:hypothetical protein
MAWALSSWSVHLSRFFFPFFIIILAEEYKRVWKCLLATRTCLCPDSAAGAPPDLILSLLQFAECDQDCSRISLAGRGVRPTCGPWMLGWRWRLISCCLFMWEPRDTRRAVVGLSSFFDCLGRRIRLSGVGVCIFFTKPLLLELWWFYLKVETKRNDGFTCIPHNKHPGMGEFGLSYPVDRTVFPWLSQEYYLLFPILEQNTCFQCDVGCKFT